MLTYSKDLEEIRSLEEYMKKFCLNGQSRKKNKEEILTGLKFTPLYGDGIIKIVYGIMAKEYGAINEEIDKAFFFGKTLEEEKEIIEYHKNG